MKLVALLIALLSTPAFAMVNPTDLIATAANTFNCNLIGTTNQQKLGSTVFQKRFGAATLQAVLRPAKVNPRLDIGIVGQPSALHLNYRGYHETPVGTRVLNFATPLSASLAPGKRAIPGKLIAIVQQNRVGGVYTTTKTTLRFYAN